MSPPSDYSMFSERLTPSEVAQHWFRRSANWGRNIHTEFPDFPSRGPDGLFLRQAVKEWFDHWHGRKEGCEMKSQFEEEALRIAKYGRR
jgi:hypothetical protein